MMKKMVNLQELQRQRPKARLPDALLNGHENKNAYVAIWRVHVSDIDGHEYKSLVSYKRHVGPAYILLRVYSLTGVPRHSVNKIIKKELCYRFDMDDMKTSPNLQHKSQTSNQTSHIFHNRDSRSITVV